MKRISFVFLFLYLTASTLHADILERSGKGFLEKKEGQQILHLEGTPYEIGYQHGVLLNEQIANNIAQILDKNISLAPMPPSIKEFLDALPQIIPYIPESLIQEMHGIADGSGIPYSKILLLNLFPEMFHCSGLTVKGEATADGKLYHVRVLDYAVARNLQNSAVLLIVNPHEGYAFANVSYAGFIGSVTGINEKKIAIGEIGGKGYGYWKGMPMAFLLRQILQNASSLNDIKEILSTTQRTCEYYYVFSDGKSRDSFAAYATATQLHYIYPGAPYAFLSPKELPKNFGNDGKNDKFFTDSFSIFHSPYQTAIFTDSSKRDCIASFYSQPADALIMSGAERYSALVERLMNHYGSLTTSSLIEIIKQPIAHSSNLHNAIFIPESLEIWVSHAGPQNQPACDQEYHYCDLNSLFHN